MIEPFKFVDLSKPIKDEDFIDGVINGLKECEGHLDKRGCRDYDKVPYNVTEDAVVLLLHYKQILNNLNPV